MNLLEKIDKKVRNWLLDCFDVVDAGEHSSEITKLVGTIESMQEKCDEVTKVCKPAVDAIEKMQYVTVSIPATWAPWYEDEKFSRLLWDKLKADCITMCEDGDRKYASIAVMPKEALSDLSR